MTDREKRKINKIFIRIIVVCQVCKQNDVIPFNKIDETHSSFEENVRLAKARVTEYIKYSLMLQSREQK